MKGILVAIAISLVTQVTQGAPVESEKDAQLLEYDYNADGKGNYILRYATTNGIKRSETGTVMDEGLPSQYILVEGRVSYTSPDGEKQSWTYKANKDGYQQTRILLMPGFYNPETDEERAEIPDGVVASLLG